MKKLYYILAICLLVVVPAYGQGGPGVGPAPGVALQDEGVAKGRVQILNCTGAGIVCSKSGVTGAVTVPITDLKAIYGLTYANSAGDVVNDLDIAAGGAIDSTGVRLLVGAASTKQSDVGWAVGTNAGCLDIGAVANADYYLFIIVRSDTSVVDYLCSLSATAPTMPANYDFKRLIGWYKILAATVVLFTTYETEGGGLELLWNTPTLDIDLANTLTTARRTDAVKVPLNFSVIAQLNMALDDNTALFNMIIYCPDMADIVPSGTVAPLSNGRTYVIGQVDLRQISVRTNATGLVASRATITVDRIRVSTLGFIWSRR